MFVTFFLTLIKHFLKKAMAPLDPAVVLERRGFLGIGWTRFDRISNKLRIEISIQRWLPAVLAAKADTCTLFWIVGFLIAFPSSPLVERGFGAATNLSTEKKNGKPWQKFDQSSDWTERKMAVLNNAEVWAKYLHKREYLRALHPLSLSHKAAEEWEAFE